ncbi:MAG TPA: cupin domain-containing protein [Alphaproteobacteria bacterium]|nr:cupin domain-containing protein [Alphaproteobacteria bacterium]
MDGNEADAIIRMLNLQPHPEGGHFIETWRDRPADGGRGSGTAIYFLLRAGEISHWHKVDAIEIWHWHAGAPLTLSISEDETSQYDITLGPDLTAGHRPQGIVPKHAWQAARSLGDWTLVGCTVSPAFDFAGFVLAPKGWAPGR